MGVYSKFVWERYGAGPLGCGYIEKPIVERINSGFEQRSGNGPESRGQAAARR